MAADAVGVLDGLGIARAHVYAISMGGMIAQELALRWPERVGALVLGATSAGGALATAPDPETLAFLARRASLPDEEGRWASVPYVYSERTRDSGGARIGEDFAHRRSYVFQPEGYRAQLAAAAGHDTAARLAEITVPTLIVHGAEDRMVPPANGRALAAAIPGARLLELEHAAHLYTTDEPAADEAVLEFLAS
jgi:pimeloyl-ACP methyl ester carboxylesterase